MGVILWDRSNKRAPLFYLTLFFPLGTVLIFQLMSSSKSYVRDSQG